MTTDPTPESVEALALQLEAKTVTRSRGVYSIEEPDPLLQHAAATLRALSARLAELEQETHAESTRAEVAEARADAAEAKLRQIKGMALEGCAAPNAAYRWCERIEDVTIRGPQEEYEEWAANDEAPSEPNH